MLYARDIYWTQGGKTILRDIRFHLKPGEVVGLVGPNGSGKSSLLKILAGLERPSSGELTFRGQPLTNGVPLQIRRCMAIVFQEPRLLAGTVFDNVAAGLKIRRIPKHEAKPRVEKWLERFGIGHLAKQPARSLSGGEAQRASLARAFVLEPDVLFLDEPFSALDAPTKEALLEDLAGILQTTGTTALLVSHDFRDIQRLTRRAAVLIDGHIAAEGNPACLLETPQTDPVEMFLSHWRRSLTYDKMDSQKTGQETFSAR